MRHIVIIGALCMPAIASAQEWRTNLTPSNGSGVTGQVRVSMNNGVVTIHISAVGLEPNQVHPQHIHGFADRRPSMLPPPSADQNGNGLIETPEAVPFLGPILLDLNPLSVGPTGVVDFTQTLNLSAQELAGVFPLDLRAYEIHGLTADLDRGGPLPPAYDADLPVAGGIFGPPIPSPGTAVLAFLATILSFHRRRG